jgi:hypothetical protein
MSTPDSDEEMVRLRAEFPSHRIGTLVSCELL